MMMRPRAARFSPRGHRQQAALNDQRFDHSVNPAGANSSRARGGAERRAPAAELPAIRPTRWRRPARLRLWPTSQFSSFSGIRFGANDGARAFGANGNPDALEPQIQLPILTPRLCRPCYRPARQFFQLAIPDRLADNLH